MSVYDTLKSLNIELPPVAVPAAAYVPFVQSGNLVFLSGHIAKKDGKVWGGQLGKDIGTAEGQQGSLGEEPPHLRQRVIPAKLHDEQSHGNNPQQGTNDQNFDQSRPAKESVLGRRRVIIYQRSAVRLA